MLVFKLLTYPKNNLKCHVTLLCFVLTSSLFAQNADFDNSKKISIKPVIQYDSSFINVKKFQNKQFNHFNTNRANSVNCPPNIDFEEGTFNLWTCDTGFVRGVDFLYPITNQIVSGVFGTTV